MDGTAKFTLGANPAKEGSDDDEDDDDDDVVIGRTPDKVCRQSSVDAFIPSVGIVHSNTSISVDALSEKSKCQYPPNIADVSLTQVVQHDVSIRKYPLQHSSTEIKIDVSKVKLERPQNTPGIVIEDIRSKTVAPNNLELDKQEKHHLSSSDSLDRSKKFSHSSGEVDTKDGERRLESGLVVESDRRNSERNLALGISSSQSENAIKSIKATAATVLTSPSTVFSPFSKLAKGVQSFGATLDPRKVVEKVGTKQGISFDHISEENKKLQDKWNKSNCKSRLIAV